MTARKEPDLTGVQFGALTAVELVGRDKHRKALWRCVCKCGGTTISQEGNLKTGKAKSCGCARRETCRAVGDRVRTHGMSKTTTYNVWKGMLERCHNLNSKDYHRYGGAGITVCDRWRSFENFLADMGERPEGKSIDRINNALGYEPGNCRWATGREQNINRSISRMVTIGDITQCISDWMTLSPVAPSTVRRRLQLGMGIEEALFTKPGEAVFGRS
jgi:hypothetical protein